ncbi:MAG: hypothetical protein QF723_02795 [Phycisphaerales bacterium]|jgi:hypothetical protein|nr:hypothetical protein [Phycisphaerales bacterium]MDP6310557.1 hypothetical protein [Phycisphaerales bacterium]MDP7086508.1 hypothetical protein [Phycisphaerales bacterium]MDP7188537.1 hypothetical protein [Phycisphaerales bacterium]MDP7519663.1 hypothetical protein [Phycisphaerales bacterium]|tara:strand:- start:2145 stop:2501 length:357 start_codon:yes stop_codon:yes gene_type:complete
MSEVEETNTPEEEPRPHHVTMIRSVERQVGEHVLAALNEDEAIAAITTLVPGVRNDRIVSMPLDREQVEAIQGILEQAHAEAEGAEDDEPGRREGFLGFHTVLKLEGEEDAASDPPEA